MPGLSCSMWGLVPWPGIELRLPTLGVWSLSHWTTREVPNLEFSSSGNYAPECGEGRRAIPSLHFSSRDQFHVHCKGLQASTCEQHSAVYPTSDHACKQLFFSLATLRLGAVQYLPQNPPLGRWTLGRHSCQLRKSAQGCMRRKFLSPRSTVFKASR